MSREATRSLAAFPTAGDRVRCWGGNDDAELGSPPWGVNVKNFTPVEGQDANGPVALTGAVAGWFHSCAIVPGGNDGKRWGKGDLGQLGHGSSSPSVTPVDVTFP